MTAGPTLLVLAAGRSTRYGRLKQTDPLGPSGETIVDYTVFDALRAGFDRVVFVIRTDIEEAFREAVGRRVEQRVDVRYVFQDAAGDPPRAKPWGTTPAVLAAEPVVDRPFGVVNADDHYGRGSLAVLGDHLGAGGGDAALVGFALRNTLSSSGGVTRGICRVAADGTLRTVDETFDITADGPDAVAVDRDGSALRLSGDDVVSMNMWGFPAAVFGPLRARWEAFLDGNRGSDTAELPLPDAVTEMIGADELDVRVLPTADTWFGVTHPDDRPDVVERFRRLVERGVYPHDLWEA